MTLFSKLYEIKEKNLANSTMICRFRSASAEDPKSSLSLIALHKLYTKPLVMTVEKEVLHGVDRRIENS